MIFAFEALKKVHKREEETEPRSSGRNKWYPIRFNTARSWVEPQPLCFHPKNNFLSVFYVVIRIQKSILKNRTPRLY